MSKAKKPKAQKMVAHDEGQPKFTHRSKVNMHLPTGQLLHVGEAVNLSEESHAHLQKHFGDNIHHVIEDVPEVVHPSAPPAGEPAGEEPEDEDEGAE